MVVGMGLCYAARHDLESALFWFEKALALHPGLHLVRYTSPSQILT